MCSPYVALVGPGLRLHMQTLHRPLLFQQQQQRSGPVADVPSRLAASAFCTVRSVCPPSLHYATFPLAPHHGTQRGRQAPFWSVVIAVPLLAHPCPPHPHPPPTTRAHTHTHARAHAHTCIRFSPSPQLRSLRSFLHSSLFCCVLQALAPTFEPGAAPQCSTNRPFVATNAWYALTHLSPPSRSVLLPFPAALKHCSLPRLTLIVTPPCSHCSTYCFLAAECKHWPAQGGACPTVQGHKPCHGQGCMALHCADRLPSHRPLPLYYCLFTSSGTGHCPPFLNNNMLWTLAVASCPLVPV